MWISEIKKALLGVMAHPSGSKPGQNQVLQCLGSMPLSWSFATLVSSSWQWNPPPLRNFRKADRFQKFTGLAGWILSTVGNEAPVPCHDWKKVLHHSHQTQMTKRDVSRTAWIMACRVAEYHSILDTPAGLSTSLLRAALFAGNEATVFDIIAIENTFQVIHLT